MVINVTNENVDYYDPFAFTIGDAVEITALAVGFTGCCYAATTAVQCAADFSTGGAVSCVFAAAGMLGAATTFIHSSIDPSPPTTLSTWVDDRLCKHIKPWPAIAVTACSIRTSLWTNRLTALLIPELSTSAGLYALQAELTARIDHCEKWDDIVHGHRHLVTRLTRSALTDYHSLFVTIRDDIMHVRNHIKFSKKKTKMIEGHPHGARAQGRWVALNTIAEFARAVDGRPYSFFTGRREDTLGWDGSKRNESLNDFTEPYRTDPLNDDHVVVFMDSDYHATSADFEVAAGHKIVIYTVEVDAVGGADPEGLWHVDGDIYTEYIAGGICWRHRVWSYDHDLCIIREPSSWDHPAITQGYRTEPGRGWWMYHIERLRFPDSNKMLVFLNPKYHCIIPWEVMKVKHSPQIMDDYLLDRMSPVSVHETAMGSFRMSIVRGAHPYITITHLEHTRHVVKLPLDLWESLKARRKGMRSFGCETVDGHCKHHGHKQSAQSVVIITGALHAVPESIHYVGYTADINHFSEADSPAVIAVPPVVVPAVCASQTDADINVAIDKLQEVKNTTRFPPSIRLIASEFSHECARRSPWELMSHQETIDHMIATNPHRKEGIEKFLMDPSNGITERTIYAQMKADLVPPAAARKGKAVRIILPEDTYKLYCDTRFVRPWCKQMMEESTIDIDRCGHWYMPGKKADRISHYVCNATTQAEARGNVLHSTDFSKFDLHASFDTRKAFEEAVSISCRTPAVAAQVRMAIRSEMNTKITPKIKRKKNDVPVKKKHHHVDSGTIVCSGAADTTALNTFTNGLISYITLRLMSYGHLEAFDMLLPKYGDDGIEEFIHKWMEVCATLGFIGTFDHRESNSDVLFFLSRAYLNPLVTMSSVCCVERALSKLCGTIPAGRSVDIARLQKATGYMVADAHTPLVGAYAKAILLVYGLEDFKDPFEVSPAGVTSGEEREMRWKAQSGPYPFEDDFLGDAVRYAAADCGLDVMEIEQLCDLYANARTHEDMEALATQMPSPIVAAGFRAVRN